MPPRPSARLGYVKCVRHCTDALVRLASALAEIAALLLGFHFWITLHVLRLLTASSTRAAGRRSEEHEQVRSQSLIRLRSAPGTRNPVHLTTLDLHTLDGAGSAVDTVETLGAISRVVYHFHSVSDRLASVVYANIGKMVDHIETRGGLATTLLARMRRCESHVSEELISRLPTEIVDHILLLAAMPDHIGSTGNNSTTIALLSKAHYRMVTPRLYANVHLTDAVSFRRFRMTLALHNPALGHHVRSLSVASSKFDAEGYLPDQVAEHITLGVGIEQILLGSPQLQHLFLDLFSLAALHNGTGSRLEKGALPISLTTEFSMPQYLTLPTFLNLRHVELTVFGLDNNAVDWFRQVLPQLETLTLRWVSRRTSSRGGRGADHGRDTRARPYDEDTHSSEDEDCSEAERDAWREGGRRHQDMLLFVEAIEILRRWPFHEQQQASGTRLEAVSVLAWPKAYRELQRYYNARQGVSFGTRAQGQQVSPRFWNASLRCKEVGGAHERKHDTDSLEHARSNVTFSDEFPELTPQRLLALSQDSHATPLSPAPLRIAVDPTYGLGSRRGPLHDWYEQRKAAVWTG